MRLKGIQEKLHDQILRQAHILMPISKTFAPLSLGVFALNVFLQQVRHG
jgi:hypothetical protein